VRDTGHSSQTLSRFSWQNHSKQCRLPAGIGDGEPLAHPGIGVEYDHFRIHHGDAQPDVIDDAPRLGLAGAQRPLGAAVRIDLATQAPHRQDHPHDQRQARQFQSAHEVARHAAHIGRELEPGPVLGRRQLDLALQGPVQHARRHGIDDGHAGVVDHTHQVARAHPLPHDHAQQVLVGIGTPEQAQERIAVEDRHPHLEGADALDDVEGTGVHRPALGHGQT
jgi:hypothetical protein